MLKILVTGRTGFIGLHVVDLFLEEDFKRSVTHFKVLELAA